MKIKINGEEVVTIQKVISYQDIMKLTGNEENAKKHVTQACKHRGTYYGDTLFFNDFVPVRRNMEIIVEEIKAC